MLAHHFILSSLNPLGLVLYPVSSIQILFNTLKQNLCHARWDRVSDLLFHVTPLENMTLWEALQRCIFSGRQVPLSRWVVIPTPGGCHCTRHDFGVIPGCQVLVWCKGHRGWIVKRVRTQWIGARDRWKSRLYWGEGFQRWIAATWFRVSCGGHLGENFTRAKKRGSVSLTDRRAEWRPTKMR